MTVTYSAEVATSKGFGCFWKLLFRWRGSIYKLLWPDLGLYFSLYFFLSLIYRFALDEPYKRLFENLSVYCRTYGDLIPVSFILGFYVSIVVKRWWDSFNCIPWPDTLAFFVSAYIHGQDDRGRLMRRSIMRYANLAFVVTLTCISPCVKKRFPTMEHLVDAGILLPNERKVMEQLKTTHSTYWMPLVWASSIAIRARKEGRIRDDFALNTLVEAIASYRSLCGGLYNYDWVSIPLVYTQVVTLVVYTFFLAALMGRQYLDPEQGHPGYDVDLYIPIFSFLQFFFYMGWLKVAETLVNPFGEDDDDFEVNWVIDRDIQVSYLIVDEMHQEHPELIKDQYWDEILPDLPYTAAAMAFYSEPPMGSAANLVVPPHEAEFLPLETLEENDELDDVKVMNGIPCEGTNNNTKLTQNLSGSSYSGLSKLGRSFNPTSYEGKGILNMMQDLFSRESSVRKKKLWKAPSKDSTIGPSPSCETSCPPTPDEFKRGRAFNDDIFHLSDLSLAESRGTGSTQSPGYFSAMHAEDIFFGKKRDRRGRKVQRSVSKVSTPQSEVADDETLRTSNVLRNKSNSSLKQFFRSSKYRGSQKSLLSTATRGHGSRPKLSFKFGNSEASNENLPSDVNDQDVMLSPDYSDEEVTVIEAAKEAQNISKSTNYIDKTKNSKVTLPMSFNRATRCSLPQTFNFSPEKSLKKMTKQPSTSTLTPGSSLEDASSPKDQPPSDIQIPSTSKTPQQNVEFSTKVTAPKRKFLQFHPKRATSLHISDRKNSDTSSLSGIQKFFGRHKNFQTVSQPVSPTGVESPFFKRKVPSRKSLFGRKREMSDSRRASIESENDAKGADVSSQSLVKENNKKNLFSKSSDV